MEASLRRMLHPLPFTSFRDISALDWFPYANLAAEIFTLRRISAYEGVLFCERRRFGAALAVASTTMDLRTAAATQAPLLSELHLFAVCCWVTTHSRRAQSSAIALRLPRKKCP